MGTELLHPYDCLKNHHNHNSPFMNQRVPIAHSTTHHVRKDSSMKFSRRRYPSPSSKGVGAVVKPIMLLTRGQSSLARLNKKVNTSYNDYNNNDNYAIHQSLVKDPLSISTTTTSSSSSSVGEYAGSAFVVSPSPESVPLPSFSTTKMASVDCSATRDLRRLLGLE